VNNTPETVRLPLWRNALEKLQKDGIHHGQVITAEWFESELRARRDELEFCFGISEIRRELEKLGFYLSGRGQKGNQFVILPPSSNASVMQGYSRRAMDSLKRGVILGTNTRLDLLSEHERKRHETVLEKMAIRAALISRSAGVARVVKKHAPKLLSEKAAA
jgi:hypothetical protein